MYDWLKVRSNNYNEKFMIDDEGEFISYEDEIPKGWRFAFGQELIEEINVLLEKYDYVNEYRILQIKEKFGKLRWYCGSLPGEIYDKHETIIDKYEELSSKYCIECGKKGFIRRDLFYTLPLCEEHYREHKKE